MQELKSWSPFFRAIKLGLKKHDLRSKRDREFRVGEIIILCEYDQIEGRYTGEKLAVEITYITSNDFPCAYSSAFMDRDAVILSLEVVSIDGSSDRPTRG